MRKKEEKGQKMTILGGEKKRKKKWLQMPGHNKDNKSQKN